jgi:hypothetical protein
MLLQSLRTALAAAGFALITCVASGEPLTSVYTDLEADRCQTLEIEEGMYSRQRCPGVAGYHLLVLDHDARMSIDVEDPAGKGHPLDLWTLVDSRFSSLGPRAEWRLASDGKTPVALIVRFNATDPETNKVTSYLAVAKIGTDGICLVEAVPPGAEANQTARDVADGAGGRPCLKAAAP